MSLLGVSSDCLSDISPSLVSTILPSLPTERELAVRFATFCTSSLKSSRRSFREMLPRVREARVRDNETRSYPIVSLRIP